MCAVAAHFRGKAFRAKWYGKLGAAIGMPDLAVAKEHAKSLLPHAQDGQLLPLSCPIECFQVFGSGVYAYMRWAQLMKRIFFVCFLA